MKIIFIGSGNVATHLSKAMKLSGHEVLQVYSKTPAHAKKLARILGAEYADDLAKLRGDADIYFICVTDNAIGEIAEKINSCHSLVVHTSGSVDMNILRKTSENYGVFYPMQTFSKQLEIDWSKVPVFIESNKKKTESVLQRIASDLAGKKNVYKFNSQQRKKVHLAAVFVNNFVNHLYVIAENILKKNDLPFKLVESLILETALKVQKRSPVYMQTGPAKRGDKKIISEHLKMLESFPAYQKIYRMISGSIADKEKRK